MQNLLDESLFTHLIMNTLDGIGSFCDHLELEFCRPSPLDKNEDELPSGVTVEAVDDVFDGVPVRLYHPNSVSDGSLQPAVLYIHGAVVMGEIGKKFNVIWIIGLVSQFTCFTCGIGLF